MLRFFVLVAALAAACGVAHAQDVPPPPSPYGVVVLDDGSAVRGWFLENVPHHHVALRALDGSLRRFEASEVSRVVPGTWLPRMRFPTPQLGPWPQTVHVRLRSREAGLRVVFRSNDDMVWKTVCVTPCETRIEPDVYRVRLEDSGGQSEAGFVHVGADHATLVAHRESRQAARAVGWTLLVVSAVTAVSSVVTFFVELANAFAAAFVGGPTYDLMTPLYAAAVAGLVAVISLIPALLKDDAGVRVARR